MRKKVGTVLDQELLWAAKELAARRKQPLSGLIEEALRAYVSRGRAIEQGKRRSVVADSRGAFRISPKRLKIILEEEGPYDP